MVDQITGLKNIRAQMKAKEKEMMAEEKRYTQITTAYGGIFDVTYDITLFFDALDYKGQATHAHLNYHKVAFKRVIFAESELQQCVCGPDAEGPGER